MSRSPSAGSGRTTGRPSSYLHRACENCSSFTNSLPDTAKFAATGKDLFAVDVASSLHGLWSRVDIRIAHRRVASPHIPKRLCSQIWEIQQAHWSPVLTGTMCVLELHDNSIPVTQLYPRIEAFLRQFARHQFFFLDPARIQQSTSLPPDDPNLLSVGLLHTVRLWANHIARPAFGLSTYSEPALLAHAVHHVAQDAASINATHAHLLDLIQAEVLLSFYYLDCGRSMEGNYHRAIATSLALTARLHQLRGPPPQSRYSIPDFFPVALPQAVDQIRARERVDAFWSVVVLNNFWVASSGTASNGIPSDVPISTPGPMDHSSIAPSLPSSSSPAQPGAGQGHYPFTLLTIASTFLQRTIAFTTRHSSLQIPPTLRIQEHQRLDTFRDHLLHNTSSDPSTQMALATHLFVNTAILRLGELNCASCPVAQAKCRTAASHISLHLDRARLGEWERADPIFGPLLGIIADVLANILPYVPEVETNLQTTLEALRTLARCSPCIQQCLLVATQQQQAFFG
ncbi:hypothetical protein C8R46DRAFT_1190705 [Mycena filopes]|nr:hypothetical protein C8R46DRAFT_1190705 [Mycena filopes]